MYLTRCMYVFAVFLVLIILSGCWDRMEVNDLGIVVGVGLEETEDNQVEFSAQIVNPQGMSGGQPSTVKTAKGKTAFDAVSKLQQKFSRRLFIGHNRVYIIGEKMAKQGIRNHIELFTRHPNPRLRAYVFVTKGNPADLLRITPVLERGSAEFMRELANFKIGVQVTLKDLLQMTASPSRGAILPVIEPGKDTESPGVRLNGSAIFKDGKIVGYVNTKLTRGILYVLNKVDKAVITIQPEGEEGFITFDIIRTSTELIPEIKNDNWKMTIKINSVDDAVENDTTLNLMNPKIVRKLESQLEKALAKRVRLAVKKVQEEMQVDVLGFDKIFHRKYPNDWAKVKNRWEGKFPDVEVKVQATVRIQRPGRTTYPPTVPENEVTGK
ncbi:Ger(x)C family spore germination protein [Virgibacillus kekensis]|uniref:Ger(X)C family spore germination protein n=1 Tax=Virgibacillus kekensis TaxID=202261 RepID=A0ABV9DPY6_9BACI